MNGMLMDLWNVTALIFYQIGIAYLCTKLNSKIIKSLLGFTRKEHLKKEANFMKLLTLKHGKTAFLMRGH